MNASEYGNLYRLEESHWWYVALHDLVLAFLPKNREGLRLFDAGCGTGRLLELLGKRGAAEGCDLSDEALHFCSLRGVSASKNDLNTMSLEPGAYDVITSIDVLYHREIGNDEAVLSSFYSALKPGGRLIFQVPAYEWLWSSHDVAVQTARRYTRKRVVRMARTCGFLIEKATYRVTFLFGPIALVRLCRKIFRGCAVDENRSDVRQHSPVVNALFRMIMKAENEILKRWSLPFGTSVFLIAQRPEGTGLYCSTEHKPARLHSSCR